MAKKMVELERLIHVAKENIQEVTERFQETSSFDDQQEIESWKIVVKFLEAWK